MSIQTPVHTSGDQFLNALDKFGTFEIKVTFFELCKNPRDVPRSILVHVYLLVHEVVCIAKESCTHHIYHQIFKFYRLMIIWSLIISPHSSWYS